MENCSALGKLVDEAYLECPGLSVVFGRGMEERVVRMIFFSIFE